MKNYLILMQKNRVESPQIYAHKGNMRTVKRFIRAQPPQEFKIFVEKRDMQ